MYRKEKIRGKQAELDLTNEALADKAGVGVNTVSAIRNGKSVTTDSLEKVIQALGLSAAEVFEQSAETVGVS
jgi:transcriptional regulator with XRE-family HTH domain